MFMFFYFAGLYLLMMLFYRPYPHSLHEDKPSYLENFKQIKGTFFLGAIIIALFYFSFVSADENTKKLWLALTAVDNIDAYRPFWMDVLKFFVSNFMHLNPNHLIANLIGLAMVSFYERRVGTLRYLSVFMVGGLLSSFSIFFYSNDPKIIVGASGGLFALFAGYFTDHKNLSLKEWVNIVIYFTVIGFIYNYFEGQKSENAKVDVQIDHIGHVLGAIAGIVYCRLKRNK